MLIKPSMIWTEDGETGESLDVVSWALDALAIRGA